MTTQNQILIDNYLGFLHSIERSHMITEQDYMIEMITKEKLVNLTRKQLKYIERALSKLKINAASIKSKAKDFGIKLEKDYKKGLTYEQASKKLTTTAVTIVGNSLYQVKDKVLEMPMGEKILVSIASLLVVIFVSAAMGGVATVTLGPKVASFVTTVVVAPMIEEAAKNYFVQQKMPWVGTGVIFGIEAVSYIITLFMQGFTNISKTLLLRLITLLMHFATTYIQKQIIEKGESENKEFIAWTVGVGIHASWNILAILLDVKIGAWLKG